MTIERHYAYQSHSPPVLRKADPTLAFDFLDCCPTLGLNQCIHNVYTCPQHTLTFSFIRVWNASGCRLFSHCSIAFIPLGGVVGAKMGVETRR